MSKATSIRLGDFKTPQMRAFHMAWVAFFVCFFGWFGLAPLMPVIRDEFHLTRAQIGNLTIASVLITVAVRVITGFVCDRIGPRRTYTWLLIAGSLPVMAVGLAHNYETFLFFRLAIGAIGASFVVTQYHTSVMFAPNVVGTANAASAGWGNLGAGVTQIAMPLLFAGFVSLGAGKWWGWRMAMFVPGVVMLLTGVAYYRLTQDTPEGPAARRSNAGGAFAAAVKDRRVWALFVIYGACFGMELTINNIAALYFTDNFHLSLTAAGLVAGSFGMMDIFARATGGILSDRFHRTGGLQKRVRLLGCTILCEGLALMLFSRMRWLPLAIAAMMLTGLFVKMSSGATFGVVPFVNRKALGAVAGIVGAGGNAGSVLAGFLFKSSMPWPQVLLLLGIVITGISALSLVVRFSGADEDVAGRELAEKFSPSPAMAGAMGD